MTYKKVRMEQPLQKVGKSPTTVNTIYRYVIDHDMGFAPNPFHGTCTVAACKPVIRRCAKLGDFVVGFGAAASDIPRRLIYWMRVEEILSFDQYWHDERFQKKKPIINGSYLKYHGDNIYRLDGEGNFIQSPSFHSLPDGEVNLENLQTDTGSSDRVLISQSFGYYGVNALVVPDRLSQIVATGRGHRTALDRDVQIEAIEWLLSIKPRGFVAEPSGWRKIR